jgi:hypothetical protein
MSKPKQAVAVVDARTRTRVVRTRKSRQELIDERVIAEAHDDSAWEAPIEVKRQVTPAVIERWLRSR